MSGEINEGVYKKFIDLENIFKEKNPKIYKFLPKFVLNYLKKTIHQDEINDFQNRAKDLKELEYLDACIDEVGAIVSYEGLENIPQSGGVIIASNHPLGGLDGIAMMQTMAKKRPDIRFLVNDILTNLKNFGKLFVPVNKIGKNSAEYLQKINDMYASDAAVLIFPAGLVSRKIEGNIVDLEWKRSFINASKSHKHDIIPVYIEGKLSPFFYRLSAFRKAIGIKANIEMLYLADELYRQRNQKVHIKIGKPISCHLLSDSLNDKEWAQVIREFVYILKNDLNASFEDFLKIKKIN